MSCSGSETSTDISMSSLENLSTSARQEPQGEETADLTSGLLDAGGVSASSSSLSSVCEDEVDAKWQYGGMTSDVVTTTTSHSQQQQQQQQQSTQSSTMLSQSSNIIGYRPVVSAGAANSLIRQLLQTSPQYSHLLSDLEPMCAGGSGVPGATEGGKSTGSPKSALRNGGWADGRSLPETPATSSCVSSSRSGLPTYSSNQTAAVSRRLVNKYVNVDEDSARSKQQLLRGYRDKLRPSTAPSQHPPPPANAPSLSVTRVQTVADPVERRRSFEVVDRVTGATLPRPSSAKAAANTTDSQRKLTTIKRTSPPQVRDPQPQQPQRTSPQHLHKSSPAQQQQQQQRVNGSAQCQQDQTLSTPSSSSALCAEQQCSAGDNQRSSPQTVWYVRTTQSLLSVSYVTAMYRDLN